MVLDEASNAHAVSMAAVSPTPDPNNSHTRARKTGFDFRLTEGQSRRNAMADSELECSQILDFFYVAGHKVAESHEKVSESGITQVVNCSAAVVPSYFEHMECMNYLTLNMVDGRQDDISWFLPQVVAFLEKGRMGGIKTLIHCEKGISRSCSYAIAYLMWSTGRSWREAFDLVKLQRPVCSPNTGFTCNLIELGDLLDGEAGQCTKVRQYDSSVTLPLASHCMALHGTALILP
jgi:predicted protein tyrosine phosphatase